MSFKVGLLSRLTSMALAFSSWMRGSSAITGLSGSVSPSSPLPNSIFFFWSSASPFSLSSISDSFLKLLRPASSRPWMLSRWASLFCYSMMASFLLMPTKSKPMVSTVEYKRAPIGHLEFFDVKRTIYP